VTTDAVKHARFQSNRHYQQNQRSAFCHPTNGVRALKELW